MIGRKIFMIAAVASLLLSGCKGVNQWEANRNGIRFDNRDVSIDASAHSFDVKGKRWFEVSFIKIGAVKYSVNVYIVYKPIRPGNGDVVEINEEWVGVKHFCDENRLEISILPNETGVARDAYIQCTSGDYGDRVAIHQSAE